MVFSLLAFSAARELLVSAPSHLRPQRRAAIDHNILQRNMAGEKRRGTNGIGDLLRSGDFAQRDAKLKLLAKSADPLFSIFIDPQGTLHIGVGGARRYRVAAHAAAQLKPDGQRQAFSAAFEAP